MYQELVYNLDLCILSYQLYSQTLVWPMDPYYEKMRRTFTNRRTNFMEEVRKNMDELLPEKFGDRFDPVVFKYAQINPWNDCFSKPDGKWDVFSAPKAIVGSIRDVYFVSGNETIPRKIATHPEGIEGKTDLLYCFEGETGKIGEKEAVKSMLGFALARDVAKDGGAYDVHIVFRGSRSGSASRAFMQGKFRERGNADWITDMDFGVLEKGSPISEIGQVCRGFKTSIKETRKNIIKCLEEIQRTKGKAPRQIIIAGHSLGGALSVHFASSILRDIDKELLPDTLKTWPFLSMKVHTFGSPVTGDRPFCDMLGSRIKITRCYSGGDPITQETFNFQGWPLTQQTHAGTMLPLPPFKNVSVEAHEPVVIRRNLIKWLNDIEIKVTEIPGNDYDEDDMVKYKDDGKPWQIRKTLKDVMELGSMKGGTKVKAFMPDFNQTYFEIYMSYLIETLTKSNSYKLGKPKDLAERISLLKKVRDVTGDARYNLKSMNTQLNVLKNQFTGEYNDASTFYTIGCLVVLRLFAENPGEAAKIKNEGDTNILWEIMEKI